MTHLEDGTAQRARHEDHMKAWGCAAFLGVAHALGTRPRERGGGGGARHRCGGGARDGRGGGARDGRGSNGRPRHR